MKAIVDDLRRLGVFYVNIGGGEPMLRPDFFEIVEYCVSQGVGVKFSTNGGLMTADKARRLAGMDYVDVQISLDGVDDGTNDAVRGEGSHAKAVRAMDHLRDAGFGPFKISVVMTRANIEQLDGFEALADGYGAELRLTRFRPSGRGAESWAELHPTQEQQRTLYHWLLERPHVLTGDSFFHLSALGEALPGLNLCGAGRVVCLIDPVGDVYACPFVLHDEFKAGSVRDPGGFGEVWTSSACSPSCASRSRPAPPRRAAATTRARAAAWPPSSSPASRSTGPIPSASRATARTRWPAPRWPWSPRRAPPTTRGSPSRSVVGRSRSPPATDTRRARSRAPSVLVRLRYLRGAQVGRERLGGLMVDELQLFDEVAETLRALLPTDYDDVQMRSRRWGIKVSFGGRDPGREHYEAQVLGSRDVPEATVLAIEVGFHAEHRTRPPTRPPSRCWRPGRSGGGEPWGPTRWPASSSVGPRTGAGSPRRCSTPTSAIPSSGWRSPPASPTTSPPSNPSAGPDRSPRSRSL